MLGQWQVGENTFDLIADTAGVVAARADVVVGYVVPPSGRGTDTLDLDQVRSRLKSLLPDYMVLTGLAAIEDIPLTVNGKVDARALPEMTPDSADYAPPQKDMEKLPVEIFGDLLGLDEVSTTANFFGIGGNSLMAMR